MPEVLKTTPLPNKILDIFFNFNDLEKIKSGFYTNIFTTKQKYILLEYLRTIYFSDYLDEYEILKQITPSCFWTVYMVNRYRENSSLEKGKKT